MPLVLAAPGIKVPLEEKPRDYIIDTPPDGEAGYSVPESAYYLRRILDGDLIDIEAPKDEPDTPAADAVVVPAKAKKGGA